jgi:hypothetical protein
MKMCQDHWDKLRKAIADRGLDHLGAKTGEQASADAVAQIEGRETEYDPLMSCHWMIATESLKMGGVYMMFQKEDGTEYCPICEALSHNCGTEKNWIDGPADAVLAHCRELKLVPSLQ